MNIESFLKENKELFDDKTMPEGHELRFEQRLRIHNKSRRKRNIWISIPSSIAAAILLFAIIIPLNINNKTKYVESEKITLLRQEYDAKIASAISSLEEVLVNVNEEDRQEILAAIDKLTDASDIMAEIAPLPEEEQLALIEYVYHTQIKSINLINKQINKN